MTMLINPSTLNAEKIKGKTWCRSCDGKGTNPQDDFYTCYVCKGKGEVWYSDNCTRALYSKYVFLR